MAVEAGGAVPACRHGLLQHLCMIHILDRGVWQAIEVADWGSGGLQNVDMPRRSCKAYTWAQQPPSTDA